MNRNDWETGIDKEAAPLKNFFRSFRASSNPAFKATANRAEALKATNPNNVKMFNQQQTSDAMRQQEKDKGMGMIGDAAAGLVGFVPKYGKQWKAGIKNRFVDAKSKMLELDAQIAGKVFRTKPGTWADKVTSREVKVKVGEEMRDGVKKDLFRTERVKSMGALYNNTKDFVFPMVGGSVVLDKAMDFAGKGGAQAGMQAGAQPTLPPPTNQQIPTNPAPLNLPPAKPLLDNEQYKTASRFEGGLLKQAALSKIAALTQELETQEELIKVASIENRILVDDNLRFKDELEHYKEAYEKTKEELSKVASSFDEYKTSLEKQARADEVKKITENLVERGIIKQAQFSEVEQHLLACEEPHLEMMRKVATSSDLKTMDVEAATEAAGLSRYAKNHLSKQGQTVEEAVLDLLSKK